MLKKYKVEYKKRKKYLESFKEISAKDKKSIAVRIKKSQEKNSTVVKDLSSAHNILARKGYRKINGIWQKADKVAFIYRLVEGKYLISWATRDRLIDTTPQELDFKEF